MKKVSVRKKIAKKNHIYILLILALLSFGLGFISPILSLLFLLFCGLFVRLFFGHLYLDDGAVVLLWGLPRSGKTCFAAKIIYDNCFSKKSQRELLVNPELIHIKWPKKVFPKEYWGYFEIPKGSLIVIDEASLNGWDSRDWSSNFNEKSLEAWKKIGHTMSAVLLTNQGFGELDCKIRDSLTSTVYYVENRGRYSRAVRMDKDVTFSEETGLPIEGYRQPTIFERIKDPSAVLYCSHKKWGAFYDSYNIDPLPPIEDAHLYEKTFDKKGRFSGFVKKS